MQYWEIHVYQADDTAGCCTNSMHAIREWISKLGIFRFRAPAHGSSNRNAGAVLRFLSVEWWTEWVCACALRTRHAFMMWLCECARSSQANGVRMPSHGMDATEYGMCVRQLNEYTQHFNRHQCCTREMSVFKVFSDAVFFCLFSFIFYFYFLLFHAACFPRHLGANAFWWNGLSSSVFNALFRSCISPLTTRPTDWRQRRRRQQQWPPRRHSNQIEFSAEETDNVRTHTCLKHTIPRS